MPSKPIYFISDLHLHAEDTSTSLRFQAFINRCAAEAQSLYILGDLFDAWLGDDQLQRDPFAQSVANQLAALHSLGCQVFLMRGNRDFTLGYRFARVAQAALLPDQHRLTLFGQPTLLLHGDELCIHDHAYQRYRRIVRNPLVLASLLALPLGLRARIAKRLKHQGPRQAPPQFDTLNDRYDADPATAQSLASVSKVQLLIHGHTHRPADHAAPAVGGARRIVLSDWQHGQGVLRCSTSSSEPKFEVIPWSHFA